MVRTGRIGILVVLLAMGLATRAFGYIDLAPTLGKIIRESQTISVVEVEKFSLEKSAVILKTVRDLKGKSGGEPIRHQLAVPGGAVPRPVLEWARPGQRAVLFTASGAALVCVGQAWYPVQSSSDGWWKPVAERPDLPLAYCGTLSRLIDALERILAGKTAIITTVQHGVEDAASFDLALNRPSVLGQQRLQRIRASLQMPQVVMAVSASKAYVVGQGPVDVSDVPELINRLSSPEATTRAESADDLRSLDARARPARAALVKLLADPSVETRMAAAAALLRIDPSDATPVDVIEQALGSTDALVRRCAARAAGSAGTPAARLTDRLAALLDDSDQLVRRAALGAIAALGPVAAGATDAVVKLLDQPETRIDAADALGRMGPKARGAQKALAKLLESDVAAVRWAGVRGMSQIGGPGAVPAVRFMMRVLPTASEVDGYNMMIYLGLIGPDAVEALPVIRNAWVKQPALKPACCWVIEPDKSFPWLATGGFGRGPRGGNEEGMDVMRVIYECYVNELGDRLKPAAKALANKIVEGTAGEVPLWAYRMLANCSEEALPVLTPVLSSDNQLKRESVVVALGYMGPGAIAAKAQVEAAVAKAANERERRLMQWCLREMAK